MTQNQFMGVLRAVVPAALAYAVAKGWVSASSSADLGAALITALAAGWSIASNIETPVAK